MVTKDGQPIEFFLTPGGYSDTRAYRLYDFDLPEGAYITGDKAYNDYDVEDALLEAGLKMSPLRKKNSKRPNTSLGILLAIGLSQDCRNHWQLDRTDAAKINPFGYSPRV